MTASTQDTVDASEGASSIVSTMASGRPPPSRSGAFDGSAAPERGDVVGRYVVIARLGAGAMGVVYAAYDPELDRKVAVKLLKPRDGRDSESARARLQREAQALAKLNHPNVVTVHDVGVHEDQVFVAMEFVEGQTLSEWMQPGEHGRPRPWSDVVRVLEAAGRGLAAAHARGLIHRDFKPDNVMLGEDGGVRVMDFGLARSGDERDLPASARASTHAVLDSNSQSALDTPLTQTGAMMGTPAYMSAEQFAGMDVTARSDQFGFCVVLFEALYGRRPFAGDTAAQLSVAVADGAIEEPRGIAVPSWLRAVVRRGLASDPAHRFDDMAQLLAALAAGEAKRRRDRVLALVAVGGLGLAGVAATNAWSEQGEARECAALVETVDAVWNDGLRDEIRAAILATEVSHATTTAEHVVPYLDAQATALAEARRETCLDTRVRARWSETIADKARWCLDERSMQLDALVEELKRVDHESVQTAVVAASQLPPVASCRDAAILRRRPEPPGEGKTVVPVLRDLFKAEAMQLAGRYADGVEFARGVVERADAVGWAPLAAAARHRLGSLLRRAGDLDAAEDMLEAAFFRASRAGATELVADTAIALTFDVGYSARRHEDGMRWAEHAAVALDVMESPADSLRRARHLHTLATVKNAAGERDEAQSLHEQALEIQRAVLGTEHPVVATSISSLALVHYGRGDYERAKALHTQALEIRRTALGPAHPHVAASLNNLALVALRERRTEDGLALAEEALALREAAFGADHANVGQSLHNLGTMHAELGQRERAKQAYRRAIAVKEKALGPDHPSVASTMANLANTHMALREYDEAEPLYQRSLNIRETVLGSDHRDLGYSLHGMARIAYLQARWEDAIRLSARSSRVRIENSASPILTGESRLIQAKILWDAPERFGGDKARARRIAMQAREDYEAVRPDKVEAVDAWLESHPA